MSATQSWPPARHDHPATSHEAAASIAGAAGAQRSEILRLFLMVPAGMTDEQLRIVLDALQSSISVNAHRARRIELTRAGLLVDSGIKRLTRAGRRAIVWRVP